VLYQKILSQPAVVLRLLPLLSPLLRENSVPEESAKENDLNHRSRNTGVILS
jgi:hypothetical protein